MGTSGLGALLVEEGLLTETDRRTIKRTCGTHGPAFARSIIALGLLDEDELAAFLAEKTQWRVAAKDLFYESRKDVWGVVDRPLIEQLEVLPLKLEGATLHVAMVDPLDFDTLKQLAFFTGYKINPVISTLSKIRAGLKKLLKDYEPSSSQLEEFIVNHASAAGRRQKILESPRGIGAAAASRPAPEVHRSALASKAAPKPLAAPKAKPQHPVARALVDDSGSEEMGDDSDLFTPDEEGAEISGSGDDLLSMDQVPDAPTADTDALDDILGDAGGSSATAAAGAPSSAPAAVQAEAAALGDDPGGLGDFGDFGDLEDLEGPSSDDPGGSSKTAAPGKPTLPSFDGELGDLGDLSDFDPDVAVSAKSPAPTAVAAQPINADLGAFGELGDIGELGDRDDLGDLGMETTAATKSAAKPAATTDPMHAELGEDDFATATDVSGIDDLALLEDGDATATATLAPPRDVVSPVMDSGLGIDLSSEFDDTISEELTGEESSSAGIPSAGAAHASGDTADALLAEELEGGLDLDGGKGLSSELDVKAENALEADLAADLDASLDADFGKDATAILNANHRADASEETNSDLGGELDASLGSDLGAELGGDLGAELGSDLGAELGGDLSADLGRGTGADLDGDLSADFEGDLNDDLDGNLRADKESLLSSDLGHDFGSDLGSELGSELGSDLSNDLGNDLGNDLSSDLSSELSTDLSAAFNDDPAATSSEELTGDRSPAPAATPLPAQTSENFATGDEDLELSQAIGANPGSVTALGDDDDPLAALAAEDSATAKLATRSADGKPAPVAANSAAINHARLSLTLAKDFADGLRRCCGPLAEAGVSRGLILAQDTAAPGTPKPLGAWDGTNVQTTNLNAFVTPELAPALAALKAQWTPLAGANAAPHLKPFASWTGKDQQIMAVTLATAAKSRLIAILAWRSSTFSDPGLQAAVLALLKQLGQKIG